MRRFGRAWVIGLLWAAAGAWAALLLTLTHVPKPPGFLDAQHRDKSLHFIAYSTLAFLTYAAATARWPRRGGMPLWIVLAGALFAAIDEVTQPLFGRATDVLDFRADMLGLLAGVTVGAIGRRILKRIAGQRQIEPHKDAPARG